MPALPFALLLFVAAGFIGNGLLMALFPEPWYGCLIAPERAALYNRHFVVDVGSAYVSAGAALIWAAFQPRHAFPLAMVALLFAGLHAGNHVYDYLSLGTPTRHVLIELLGIWMPVLLLAPLTLWLRRQAAAERY